MRFIRSTVSAASILASMIVSAQAERGTDGELNILY